MRNLLIALLLFLWLLLGWKMCNDYNTCCKEETVEAAAPATPVVEAPKATLPCNGFICFEKNECEPRFCEGWPSYRDSIINTIGSGQKLVITGLASPSEKNYSDLGACRAKEVQKAIEESNDAIVVEISGRVRVGGTANTAARCDRISFTTLGTSAEINSSTLIYFPFNSTNKLADASVETYLQQVAAQVKSSGDRIRLTGHTDSQGTEAYNMNLGQQRANIIRNYLIAQGVTASKIITESKGESQPVANNSTEEGKAKNRRTELQIIKN